MRLLKNEKMSKKFEWAACIDANYVSDVIEGKITKPSAHFMKAFQGKNNLKEHTIWRYTKVIAQLCNYARNKTMTYIGK